MEPNLESFLEVKKLLEAQFEPFFGEEISPQLDLPNVEVLIPYTFVRGPTVKVTIPSQLIKACYQQQFTSPSTMNLEGYERTGFGEEPFRMVTYEKDGVKIRPSYEGGAEISASEEIERTIYGLTLSIHPSVSSISFTAMRIQLFDAGIVIVERAEAFNEGKYTSINVANEVEKANTMEEVQAVANISRNLFEQPELRSELNGPVILKPLMDIINIYSK